MTPELEVDINEYLVNRNIKQIDLIKKYNISRNTLKKYVKLIEGRKRNEKFKLTYTYGDNDTKIYTRNFFSKFTMDPYIEVGKKMI